MYIYIYIWHGNAPWAMMSRAGRWIYLRTATRCSQPKSFIRMVWFRLQSSGMEHFGRLRNVPLLPYCCEQVRTYSRDRCLISSGPGDPTPSTSYYDSGVGPFQGVNILPA